MSFTRDAVVAQKMGLAWGVVVAFAAQRRLPIFERSPHEIRKTLRLEKGASKKDIIAAVSVRHPELRPLLEAIRGELREHAADSVGAVVAALPDLRGRS
jgi:Holliday junction resolvasome RuvABC endonuclease subunit